MSKQAADGDVDIQAEIDAIEKHLLIEALELEFVVRNDLTGSGIFNRRELEAQLDRMLAAWHWDGRLRQLKYKSPLGSLVKQATKDKNVNEPEWSSEYPDALIEQLQAAIDKFEIPDRLIIKSEAPPRKFRNPGRVRIWVEQHNSSRATYYRRLASIKETLIAKMLTFAV